ncbi:hypothetical protein ACGFNU_01975 [Spirillospora sp. NPDC048911]|uniref:hypothetical protein n=1 Tax=Spirillospora sp. NPDC048911 TaxID=3364527 RepID=UPI00371B43EE
METPETRLRTGQLVERIRRERRPRLTKREVARQAGISEIWYRRVTLGVQGRRPDPASDETWAAIAHAIGLDPERLFAELGRPWDGSDVTEIKTEDADVEAFLVKLRGRPTVERLEILRRLVNQTVAELIEEERG